MLPITAANTALKDARRRLAEARRALKGVFLSRGARKARGLPPVPEAEHLVLQLTCAYGPYKGYADPEAGGRALAALHAAEAAVQAARARRDEVLAPLRATLRRKRGANVE